MFRVGQRVVCVDASAGWTSNSQLLRKHAIYTVSEMTGPRLGLIGPDKRAVVEGIRVAEIRMEDNRDWFRLSRFRPIVERPTDISIFTRILTDADEKVDA